MRYSVAQADLFQHNTLASVTELPILGTSTKPFSSHFTRFPSKSSKPHHLVKILKSSETTQSKRVSTKIGN